MYLCNKKAMQVLVKLNQGLVKVSIQLCWEPGGTQYIWYSWGLVGTQVIRWTCVTCCQELVQ